MARDGDIADSGAAGGNDAAIGALLARHLPALRAYLRLRMGDRIRRWDTEWDLAQSICREALERPGHFVYRGEAAFRRWLFTMARRQLADRDEHLRADKRDVDRLVTNLPNGQHDERSIADAVHRAFHTPSEVAIRQETLERIERALARLSDDAREAVLLSRFAGWTTAEIAEQLGKRPSTVRVMISRALATLSAEIA